MSTQPAEEERGVLLTVPRGRFLWAGWMSSSRSKDWEERRDVERARGEVETCCGRSEK